MTHGRGSDRGKIGACSGDGARTEDVAAQDLGVRVLSIARDDEPAPPSAEDAWRELRKIVAEAVIWQDKAEELLVDISHREPLAELARAAGR